MAPSRLRGGTLATRFADEGGRPRTSAIAPLSLTLSLPAPADARRPAASLLEPRASRSRTRPSKLQSAGTLAEAKVSSKLSASFRAREGLRTAAQHRCKRKAAASTS